MKKYNSIDLMKFVAAIFVVAVHTNPFLSVSATANVFFVDTVARLAVPLFFMASGFFLSNKLSSEGSIYHVINYSKRIFILYLVWSMIYLPVNIYNWAVNTQFQMSYWMTYIRSFFFEGSYYTLWFFPALVFGACLLWFFYDLLPKPVLIPICILLYITGALGQPYYDKFAEIPAVVESYYDIFFTTRNGLFFGFPFMVLGVFAKRNLNKVAKSRCLIYGAVSFVCLTIEVFLARDLPFTKGSGMWIFVMPTAFFLFMFIAKVKLPDNHSYLMMRKMSTLIYLCHGIFVTAFAIVSSRLNITNSIFEFLFVLLPALGLSYGILVLGSDYEIDILRILYE